MVWDPTHPPDGSAVVAAPLRGNFAALDTSLIAPLTALADNLVLTKGAGPTLTAVPAGTNGYLLTLVGGVPLWQPAPATGLTNPMTAVGDLIRGGASGAPMRLPIDTDGQVLTLNGGIPAWLALPVDPGFANPMTAVGDLIRGGTGGVATRLIRGLDGHFLTLSAGIPAWAPLPVDPGFANPMTSAGDLIVGGASGAPNRLGVGSNGYVLTLVGGAPLWQPAAVTGMPNPMTTAGDLIVGGTSGAPGRLGAGTTGHVLTLVAGTPAWQAAAAGGGGAVPIPLRIEAATLPDGTGTGNNPPELVREVSTGTQTANTPKVTRTYAAFDAATDEHLSWTFMLPPNWTAGGTIRLKWKARTATSGAVVWKAGAVATIDGSSDDDASVYTAADLAAGSTAPATQGQSVEVTIPITTTGFAAGRWITLFIGRDAGGMTGDAILMGAQLEHA